MKFFYPIAKRHGLNLCDNWGTFNEVDKANLDRFIAQVGILLGEIGSGSEPKAEFNSYYVEKFAWIIEEMKLAVNRRDNVVFSIG